MRQGRTVQGQSGIYISGHCPENQPVIGEQNTAGREIAAGLEADSARPALYASVERHQRRQTYARIRGDESRGTGIAALVITKDLGPGSKPDSRCDRDRRWDGGQRLSPDDFPGRHLFLMGQDHGGLRLFRFFELGAWRRPGLLDRGFLFPDRRRIALAVSIHPGKTLRATLLFLLSPVGNFVCCGPGGFLSCALGKFAQSLTGKSGARERGWILVGALAVFQREPGDRSGYILDGTNLSNTN